MKEAPSAHAQPEDAVNSSLHRETGVSTEAILSQLEKILASPGFTHSDRMVRFLRFTVDQVLKGHATELKETVLGMEVFDRPSSFDPRTDTIVRVEARRLRTKLKEYYENGGRWDLVEVEFPKGSYVPTFRKRVAGDPSLDVPLPTHSVPEIESSPTSVIDKKQSRWQSGRWVAMGAGLALVVGAGVALWLARPSTATWPIKLVRLTSDSGLTFQPTLSPDGKLLAYASDRSGEGNLDLWLKQVEGGEPIRLTYDPADDCEPSFSPDGKRIVFRSERNGGGIYIVPAIGGEERLVVREGLRPKVSPDGKQIAYFAGASARNLSNRASKIFLVPSHGGQPQPWQPEFQFARSPLWSPEGDHLMFYGCRKMGECDWWVGSLDGKTAVKTGALSLLRGQKVRLAVVPPYPSLAPAWLPGAEADRLIFAAQSGDSTSLWQLILSRKTWQAVGPLQQVTAGTALDIDPTYASSHLVP